jgi:predicted nuclease of predicted toxin-antitoxin system
VKLLFDQNLSPSLVALLADVFPESSHVRDVGLSSASDESVWQFALEHDFAIVTKDSDFQERSQLAGTAPRIVWVRRGNCSTNTIERILRKHAADIAALEQQASAGFLILL